MIIKKNTVCTFTSRKPMNGFDLIKNKKKHSVFLSRREWKSHESKLIGFYLAVLLDENHLFSVFYFIFRIESIKHSEGNILHIVQNRSRVLCIRNKPTNWNKKVNVIVMHIYLSNACMIYKFIKLECVFFLFNSTNTQLFLASLCKWINDLSITNDVQAIW